MLLQNILKAREDLNDIRASSGDDLGTSLDIDSEERKSKKKKNNERNTKRKRGTKNYYKRNFRSRSNIMTYGAINEIAKSIQTVYYASLREKQKIREVTQRAREDSLSL